VLVIAFIELSKKTGSRKGRDEKNDAVFDVKSEVLRLEYPRYGTWSKLDVNGKLPFCILLKFTIRLRMPARLPLWSLNMQFRLRTTQIKPQLPQCLPRTRRYSPVCQSLEDKSVREGTTRISSAEAEGIRARIWGVWSTCMFRYTQKHIQQALTKQVAKTQAGDNEMKRLKSSARSGIQTEKMDPSKYHLPRKR